MTALAPCRRRRPGRARFSGTMLARGLGLALLLAGPVGAQDAVPDDAPPLAAAGPESVSASELQAAIDAIKRRVAAQQEGREATATSELAAELRSARQAIAELTRNLTRLRGERDALQADIAARQDIETELRAALDARLAREAALEDSLARAERNAAGTRAALTEARERAIADTAAHEAALAEGRAQIEAATERAATLEAALAAGEARLARLQETAAAEAESAAAERAALDTALAESRTQAAAAAARAAELETALDAAASDLEAARAEGERMAAELAGAAATRAGLEERLATAMAARADLDRRVAEAEAARLATETAMAAAITEHEQGMAELRLVASRSVAEIEALGEALLGTLAENETLVAALAEARGSRTLIEAELGAMRRDLEAHATAAAAGGAAEAVPLALVASDAVVEAIDAELVAAHRQIALLNEELIARDKQLATAGAAGDADALSQQVGLLQREVEALGAENAKLLEDLAELRSSTPPELITASLAPDEAVEHFLGQLNAVDTGDGWWLTVPEGLVFAPGSDELAPGTEPVVAQIAALLGYFGDAQVRIVGHTDSFGDAAVNRELSLQRAETVGRFLVESFAIDAARVVTEGFGEERPIASNATIEGRRANRRVEVYIQR